jgi:heme A synthase
MQHFSPQWIEEWCQENGWTDWFLECSRYWAFPPNAVMPVPIPAQVLRTIKAEKGLSVEEQVWCLVVIFTAVLAGICTYFLASPMPLVAAFSFCAIAVAFMEDDTLSEPS